MARGGSFLLAVAALILAATPADAQTFRFQAADGTVHLTNSPTDPRYQRLGGGPAAMLTWAAAPARGFAGFARAIADAARRYGVPETLISAIIRIESNFKPHAVSPKGAQGLMQLMPATASQLGVRNIFDPQENIDGGVRHLRGLMERFAYDLPLALAAYNAGEQAVITSGGIPPYPETRDYVARVLGLYQDVAWTAAAAGEPAAADARPHRVTEVFRVSGPDGTAVYTNIPPR
ncbi:MAG: lytic transglycosylase domain-containing protein [Candidatus Rokubacteria bacterium]|nr:lytic transglycosylase domain-containing protein [Candidatus Rokubacteria bacterium]